MTTKTVLTDEQIIAIGYMARAIEKGENGYILPVKFARAIEQAVLQAESETYVESLEEALTDLIAACPSNLKCCDFHHAKADQHDHDEACRPMDRYYAAVEQAQRRIGEWKNGQ